MKSLEDQEADINVAMNILKDPDQKERSIINVAFDAGFYSLKAFSRTFRRATNMCPIEYRAYHLKFKEVTGMSPEEYQQQQEQA